MIYSSSKAAKTYNIIGTRMFRKDYFPQIIDALAKVRCVLVKILNDGCAIVRCPFLDTRFQRIKVTTDGIQRLWND